jgi:AAA+ superfamily predicted ATPase
MTEFSEQGLLRIDSADIEKRLAGSLIVGSSNLDRKLKVFSELVLSQENREKLTKLDFYPTIILHGPPNTGKTIASYRLFQNIKKINSNSDFFILSISALLSSEYGETSKNIVKIFESLRTKRSSANPCILLIDEVDQICMSRSKANEHDASRRAMSSLMLELDQLHPSTSEGLLVIAITNTFEKLDSALIRRFNLKEEVFGILSIEDFRSYLSSLFEAIEEDVPSSDEIGSMHETYCQRKMTIPDVKELFRHAILEKKIDKELNVSNFIAGYFHRAYSSTEKLTEDKYEKSI